MPVKTPSRKGVSSSPKEQVNDTMIEINAVFKRLTTKCGSACEDRELGGQRANR